MSDASEESSIVPYEQPVEVTWVDPSNSRAIVKIAGDSYQLSRLPPTIDRPVQTYPAGTPDPIQVSYNRLGFIFLGGLFFLLMLVISLAGAVAGLQPRYTCPAIGSCNFTNNNNRNGQ